MASLAGRPILAASKTEEKPRGRPFQKGNRANPNGRPAGSRNAATLALDAIADGAAPEVLEKLVEAARSGDLKAMDMLLSRVWPVRKGRPVTLNLPAIKTTEDLVSAMGAVADAVAGGEITPDEGAAVASVLEAKRRTIETADLAKRIEALEAGRNGSQ